MAAVRPYRPGDAAGVDEVCVLTGAAGGDARGLWSGDDLLPDLYARPHLALEPEAAFVLDEGGGVVGYVLGTADTPRFVAAWRQRWLPVLAERWSEPPDLPVTAALASYDRPGIPIDVPGATLLGRATERGEGQPVGPCP